MFRLTDICLFVLLFISQVCFHMEAQQTIFSEKETLYSVKNGKSLGELALSVEVKSLEANPKEFYLIIGEKGNEIIASAKSRSLWIFNRTVSLNNLQREVKKLNISLDSKSFREFTAFSENNIKFELKAWDELRKGRGYLFFVEDATVGKEIRLKLHFYLSTIEKKKTMIDDDACVTLTFTVPQPAKNNAAPAKNNRQNEDEVTLNERGRTGGARGLTPEEQEIEDKEAENKKLEQAAELELKRRTDDANSFITKKNQEITTLIAEIEQLPKSLSRKNKEKTIDSLEIVAGIMKKKVDESENGYADILLKQEAIQDKFTKFTIDHTIALKMLAAKRGPDYLKWLLLIGLGLSVIMMGCMFFMQLISRIKAKKAQMMMMQQALLQNMAGMQTSAEEKKEPEKKVREMDTKDMNDLEQI